MKKKLLAILLVFVMVFSVTGCGKVRGEKLISAVQSKLEEDNEISATFDAVESIMSDMEWTYEKVSDEEIVKLTGNISQYGVTVPVEINFYINPETSCIKHMSVECAGVKDDTGDLTIYPESKLDI